MNRRAAAVKLNVSRIGFFLIERILPGTSYFAYL